MTTRRRPGCSRTTVGKRWTLFPPDALADFAIDFITRHREQPFFFYWPMHLVHRPLVATPLKPDAEKSIEKQIAMTEYADHLVGRLVQAVDELGLRDDTIVFFSGDNGSIKNRRPSRRGGKGSLTEAGVNVPFIVSGGPVVRRGRTRALTDFSDVLPTLAEFAGIAVPASWAVDGVSIAPFLTGRSEDTPREWIAAAAAVKPARDTGLYNFLPSQPGPARDRYGWRAEVMGLVVRDRRFKLWDYPQGLQALFDLQHDPHEQRNLWTSRDPAVVAAKRRLLAVRDRFPRVPAPLRSDPVTEHYGLFAHWRFDGQTEVGGLRHFPDTVGGYDARYEPRAPDGERAGKFGGALPASATPGEAAHFIDFLAGTGSQRQFRRWRRQSLTLSAWVRLAGPLAREWHLLHAASDRPFNAGLRRVIDGVEEHPPLVIATNRTGQPRIEVAGGVQPLAPGERGHVTVTASNLDPSQTYLVRLTYAGRGLGSRPNCAYRVEDSTSGVFSGVRSHTETFTVYGCPDAAEAALALTVTRAGELALQLATTRGGRANRVSAPLPETAAGWTHVAATWDGGDACGEAVVYIDGRAAARACLGDEWRGAPVNGLRLGYLTYAGPPSPETARGWLDDVAVWRQALTPAQVAGLHTLGNRFGYDAAEVDTLFNAPREYPVTVGGVEWERVDDQAAPGPSEIDFGGGIAMRPAPSTDH